jgi:hypothetical protein
MKLADFVRDKLKQEKQKEMLDLVRLASKQMLCTVAWNHLVDDRLARGQVSTALKIYNEVAIDRLIWRPGCWLISLPL